MTITIRNHITGTAIRSWNQPGTKNDVLAFANQYAVGEHAKVIYHDRAFNVYIVPGA